MLTLDHLVIAAETLEAGVAYVREALSVDIPFGGKHPLMGTNNHLMQLGPEAFLEVIAIDPEVSVDRPRWYGLDSFEGSPRLIHWVVRTGDMAAVLPQMLACVGPAIDVTRGDLAWQLTVPEDGTLPMAGVCPSIIEWPEGLFPAPRMADLACELEKLTLVHPLVSELEAHLMPHFSDPRVRIEEGELELRAEIKTHNGSCYL